MKPFACCAPALVLAVALSACSASSTETTQSPTTAPSTAAPTSAAPTTGAAPTPDAVQAVLTKAGATNYLAATAENDENHMLGRPGGYTARVAFELPGGDLTAKKGAIERGGGFEIWPDAVGAQKRHEYITTTLAANPILGTEYDYLAGTVLVRVTGKVTPANAKKVEDAVAGLPR